MAQNIVEKQRYAWEWRLGFSLDFARIPHEGLPIYTGFAPRSCVAMIRPRIYLQSEFEPDVSWHLVDFSIGDERSGLVTPPRRQRARLRLKLAAGLLLGSMQKKEWASARPLLGSTQKQKGEGKKGPAGLGSRFQLKSD
jgi:hypothetical protein